MLGKLLRQPIRRLLGIFGSGRFDDSNQTSLRECLGQDESTLVPGQVLGDQRLNIRVDREVPDVVDNRCNRKQKPARNYRPSVIRTKINGPNDR
jgi:hypothetical protein